MTIFKDINDYYRGIFSIYELNNRNLVSIWLRRQQRVNEKAAELLQGPTLQSDKRDKFVEVLAFCFMPNHIHLLVKQLKDNGISQFMRKVGTGYATYFNKKYKRKGHLFNKFKAVHIESNDQLKNVITYIHTNPIALVQPGFKEKGIESSQIVMEFLENYKWSSYQDYLGKENFKSLTQKDFILEVMGGFEGCRADVENWVLHKKEVKELYTLLE